jgi:hypothetical protein
MMPRQREVFRTENILHILEIGMIQLYQGSGASDFTILKDGLADKQRRIPFQNAARLLNARSQKHAAKVLRSVPFRVVDAINHFNDEFSMLHALVPLDQYERLRKAQNNSSDRQSYQQIADVFSELGTYIRFIVVELKLENPEHTEIPIDRRLKQSEINKLVYKYMGVSGGYLANFSYQSHYEFYIDLDLDINPYKYDGTTRERFIKILSESTPEVQARILEGVLSHFPEGGSRIRTKELANEIRNWITRLRSGFQVEQPTLRITSEVVERALLDAQELMRSTGATSGVDRIHTAIHGYLREICQNAALAIKDDMALTELFKQVREAHPAFRELGPRSDEILRILRALATILDTFNPLRNKASVAHPNPVLLPEPEAMLVINSARSILHYIDEKVYRHRIAGGVALDSPFTRPAPDETSDRKQM